MEIHSSIGKMSTYKIISTGYLELDKQYLKTGFTYKSNEILHKISHNNPKHYPYDLLLHISKIFHFNQFEIVFLSHILHDVEPCYQTEPDLFGEDIQFVPATAKIIERVAKQNKEEKEKSQSKVVNGHNSSEPVHLIIKSNKPLDAVKNEEDESSFHGFNHNPLNMSLGMSFAGNLNSVSFPPEDTTIPDLKKHYLYLLVLGYAVKYYLNEQAIIKPYDEEIKSRHPTFFATVFNRWAKKYGNTVLATTPRRINSYYLNLSSQLEADENNLNPNTDQDCQYRNYNEIVEELIKATTEGDDTELEKDPIDP